MDNQMERRWLSLFVENRAGVLARISGLFSGKAYNIHSLTVGETEDPTMSRMTICIDADEKTFEQVKKQFEAWKLLKLLTIQIHRSEQRKSCLSK